MSHDKLRNATRRRMAETGEPYTVARRAVLREQQPTREGPVPAGARRFYISYSDAWEGRLTAFLDRLLFRGGPGVSHVDVDGSTIRVRMATFHLDIPRTSVRSVRQTDIKIPWRTTGVHRHGNRWLVNGSADGLVELSLDPPAKLPANLDTLLNLGSRTVKLLVVSLEDPAGFVTALGHRSDGRAIS
jgi:hypothetical protein